MSLRSRPSSQRTADEEQGNTSSQSQEQPEEESSVDEVWRLPWKYIGYKGFAEFLSSEDDFFILRKFDELNIRIALTLQDEISVLEEKLKKIDDESSQTDGPDINNGSLRKDIPARRHLIRTIAVKLKQYSQSAFGVSSSYFTNQNSQISSF